MAVFAKPVVTSDGGLVVAQSRRAAAVGAGVLRQGGNAVDAAVATSLALGVTEPWMSGIGGGASAIIQSADGMTQALDAGMRAPLALEPGAYPLSGTAGPGLFAWPGVVADRNVTGPLAVAVPGLVAGLGLAHARFGRWPWADAVAPAVAVAETGHSVDWYTSLLITTAAPELRAQPATRAHFLRDDLPPSPDWRKAAITLDSRPLATTYRRLAEAGPGDFYHGALARRWLAEAQAAGTWLGPADLEAYVARLQSPLEFTYRDARLHAMDGLFAGVSLEATLAEVARRWPGGKPDARAYGAYAQGLSRAYTQRLATMGHAAATGATTHFCVVDADGLLVAWTQTLLSVFGAHVLLGETGILMNNGVMWFDPRPGAANGLAPGAQPLANMCPTIVATPDGRRVALGACGGRRILPAVAQLASFVVDGGDDLASAFARPRIDVSAPDLASVDPRLNEDTRAAVAAVLPAHIVADTVYPTTYAIPSALQVDGAGTRTALGATCHPWSGAVAG